MSASAGLPPSAASALGRGVAGAQGAERALAVLEQGLQAALPAQRLLSQQGPPGSAERVALARTRPELAPLLADFEARWLAATQGRQRLRQALAQAEAAAGPLARQQALAGLALPALLALGPAVHRAASALQATELLGPFLPASLRPPAWRPSEAPGASQGPGLTESPEAPATPADPSPKSAPPATGGGWLGQLRQAVGQATAASPAPGLARLAQRPPLAPSAAPQAQALAGPRLQPGGPPPSPGPRPPVGSALPPAGPRPPAVAAAPGAPRPRPQAPPLPPALAEALALVEPVHAHTAPRMPFLEGGLALQTRPEVPVTPPPGGLVVVEALACLYGQSPPAILASRQALVLATELRRGIATARQQPLGPVTAAKLRGLALPVAGFPQRFAPFPILRELFPPVG